VSDEPQTKVASLARLANTHLGSERSVDAEGAFAYSANPIREHEDHG
jgi:hypothetical protein